MSSLISEIKARLSFGEVIKLHVSQFTEKSSDVWIAKCPFHEDVDPSMHFDLSKGTFHCFGCQAHGDMIDFVERKTGQTKKEVISQLARQAGIRTQNAPALTQEEATRLVIRRAFSSAQDAYVQQFWGEDKSALAYMHGRGFSDDTLKAFGIGHAPLQSFAAVNAIKQMNMTAKQAVDCGVLAQSQKSGKVYDPMFGRITFPIYAQSGIVGFTARIFSDPAVDQPKHEHVSPPEHFKMGSVLFSLKRAGRAIREYISRANRLKAGGNEEQAATIPATDQAKYKNTPTTAHFQKGTVLFGMKQAARAIREQGFAYIVEGCPDTLAMYQMGFENTVGSLGTAITTAQIQLLHQYTSRVTLVLDGDAAGQAATTKVLDAFLREGMLVTIVTLPGEHDPHSLLFSQGGLSKLHAALKEAKCGLTTWLSFLESESAEKLADWVRSFLMSFSDPMVRLFWAKKVAVFFGVTSRDILDCTSIHEKDNRDSNDQKERVLQ